MKTDFKFENFTSFINGHICHKQNIQNRGEKNDDRNQNSVVDSNKIYYFNRVWLASVYGVWTMDVKLKLSYDHC